MFKVNAAIYRRIQVRCVTKAARSDANSAKAHIDGFRFRVRIAVGIRFGFCFESGLGLGLRVQKQRFTAAMESSV